MNTLIIYIVLRSGDSEIARLQNTMNLTGPPLSWATGIRDPAPVRKPWDVSCATEHVDTNEHTYHIYRSQAKGFRDRLPAERYEENRATFIIGDRDRKSTRLNSSHT